MDNINSIMLDQLIVKNEDVEAVGALITALGDFIQVKKTDATAAKNYTPLHVVISKFGNKDIFKSLEDFTALQRVLDKCDLHEAKVLIDAGACVDTRNSGDEYTALHVAASEANTEMINYLLSKGADINAKRKASGCTPLKDAAMSNKDGSHFETIEVLLKNGADVNDGHHLAWVLDNPKMVELFLKYKVKPTETGLLHAVSTGNVEVVRLLLNNGFDAKSLDSHNKSVLLSAVGSGNVDIVQMLIDHGFEYNSRLLYQAARYNQGLSHYKVAKMLLDMGLDVNARDDNSLYTLIHFLAWKCGSLEFIKLFLSYKPDLNLQDEDGRTPLYMAAWNENLELVKLLIDHGSDVNAVNPKNGKTPLHAAGFPYEDLKTFKWLLINGANINALDHDGYGPLVSFLFDHGCEEVPRWYLKFLLKYSNLNVINEKGVNFLDFNCTCRSEICKCKVIILKHLAKLHALDQPLHPIILERIESQKDLSDYFDKCIKELSLAKKTKLRNSWITFFNLLVDNKRKLKNYAGNEDLVGDFKKSDWSKIFPIYGAEMQENMKKGIERRELFDKSKLILSDLLPVHNPTHLLIQDVLDCVSTKELTKFCEKGAKRSQFS